MKKNEKSLQQLIQKMDDQQVVDPTMTQAIKGGSQGVSTFDLVL